jgi:hypothetical protein
VGRDGSLSDVPSVVELMSRRGVGCAARATLGWGGPSSIGRSAKDAGTEVVSPEIGRAPMLLLTAYHVRGGPAISRGYGSEP